MTEQELTQKVFQPGNLIHGTRINTLPSLLKQGIKPGIHFSSVSFSPYDICFTLLLNTHLPHRYTTPQHRGPSYDYETNKLAIIISRDRLMRAFPERLLAIGSIFRKEDSPAKSKWFGDNINENSVYGIPIWHPAYPITEWAGGFSFPEEVRLFTQNFQADAVPAQLWEGIVVAIQDLPKLKKFIEKVNLSRPFPVFSPNCQLLEIIGAPNLD